MAKLLATELSDKVMYQCLQFFGGYGYMEEFKIARMFRDSRILTIGAGTSEIMREIIAKMVIDDKSYKSAEQPVMMSNSTGVGNGFAATFETIAAKAEKAKVLGATLKFQLEDNSIFIDGSNGGNVVTQEDKAADCTVKIALGDLTDMLAGKLNPMQAMMEQKFSIDGDMTVAMKLGNLVG